MELPEELRKVAEEELNETPETRTKTLAELQELVLALPENERPERTDDLYLLRFLRPRKFDVQKALTNIKNYEKFKREHAEELQDLHAEEFRDLFGQGFMHVIDGRTKDGSRINLLIPSKMTQVDTKAFLRFMVWSFEYFSDDPWMQVKGQVIVEQFKGLTFSKTIAMQKNMPSSFMKRQFKFMQDCMPTRIAGIWLLNEPTYVSILWAMAWPFMSKKIRGRVRLFGRKAEKVFEFIDPAVLPPEFGGTLEEDPLAWLEARIAEEKKAAGDTPAIPPAKPAPSDPPPEAAAE